jgi:CBS domain-containing protein
MSDTIRDLMTTELVTVDKAATLQDVAALMRDHDVGDVIVRREGQVGGIVTDRDIVVRAVAEGEDPATATAADICTGAVVTLSPDDPVDAAAQRMADAAVRRLPVVEGGDVVGIVTLGDLARERDPGSVLGKISAEPPTG